MTAAGWYADPADPAKLRYYDGTAWSEHVQDLQPTPQAQAPLWSGTPAVPSYDPTPTAAPGRRRRKPVLIVAALAVLVLVASGGTWWYFSHRSPTLTYEGQQIADPSGVLRSAESTLASYVPSRHGVKSSDARCYFSLPKVPAAGAAKTDVSEQVLCGPVLFVDGDPAKTFLPFVLSPTSTGGKTALTVSSTPAQATPAERPSSATLTRPDGKTPPSGNGGITVPQPPKAPANVIVSTELGKQSLPAAPANAAIGSLTGGVKMTALGKVTRYGSGENAYSAPDGQQLYAFALTAGIGEDGSADLTSKVTVAIDSAAPAALPTASARYYVVAAPKTAKTVNLVLTDAGATQTLSLLDGSPGAGNVAVAIRKNTQISLSASANIPVTFSRNGTSVNDTLPTTITTATLSYWDSVHSQRPSSPGDAFLWVDLKYVDPDDHGDYGWEPDFQTVTPTGGAPIKGQNLATTAGKLYVVFEVPASFTTGTLTVSGSLSDGSGITASIVTPWSTPLNFPSG